MNGFDADAIVVGGGLVGVAAAIAVAKAGLSTIHLAPPAPPDGRSSALMMPSVDYLHGAGLVDEPAELATALTQIRIIDATGRLIRAPETLFDAAEAGLPAFGWNFGNVRLLERFQASAAALPLLRTVAASAETLRRAGNGWQVQAGDGMVLTAPLVVGADGKKSLVRVSAGLAAREQAFQQAAMVCDLELGRPIGGTSIEFHYRQGPFTLVPAGGRRANLVWIDDVDVLRQAQAGGPEQLVTTFMEKSQRLFGGISIVSPAVVLPLSTLTVRVAGAGGVVLTGEAAHAFPPIGAQGLNLGLRDVADLAGAVRDADRGQPDWAGAISRDYAGRRAADLARTGTMVDALFGSLLAEMIPVQALRAGGLWALKLTPGLRKQAFALGMGGR